MPTHARLKIGPYERTAGFLLASLVLVVAATAALAVVWLGVRRPPAPTAAPTLTMRIEQPGGGYLDGIEDGTANLPGEITPYLGVAEAEEVLELAVEQSLDLISGDVAARGLELIDPTERANSPDGGGLRNGPDGPGGRGVYGGFGDGVKPEFRWQIQYDEGGQLDGYARQLDFFGIELGVLGDDGLVRYAKGFSAATELRGGPAADEQRLFFTWQDGTRQEADRELLSRAGVDAAGRKLMQFYSDDLEQTLLRVETEYLAAHAPRRTLKTVWHTWFSVVPEGDGWRFVVARQVYLDARRRPGL